MKKNIYIWLGLVWITGACNNDFLDRNPLNSYSDPIVWSDINLAKYYLNDVYANVEYGWNSRGPGYQTGVLAGETTLNKGAELPEYCTGAIAPGSPGAPRGHLTWGHFSNIQKLNIFLEKIEKLPESFSGAERERMQTQADILKGEALFLRALFYTDICRSYGGVPLFRSANQLGEDFSLVTRSTFEETVNFIDQDLQHAAQLLPLKSDTDMGRANKEAAMALRSRILLFAASDLTADSEVENSLVGYLNADRAALWQKAKSASLELIRLGTVRLADFGAPDKEAVALNYFSFFKTKTLDNEEVIWGKMHRADVGTRIRTNQWNGPNGIDNWGNNSPYGNVADFYQMEDGSDFSSHFTLNSNGEYVNTSSEYTNKSPYKSREPRFYATILHDSAKWQKRFPDLAALDPEGIYDRRTRIVIEGGKIVSERYGLDTRQGPVSPANGNYTGYLLKKFMDDEVSGRDEYNENAFIHMRFAEVILNYAEACIELDELSEAAAYINLIRKRSGLPDFTGDIRKALKYERYVELFGENTAWFDLRRWKDLEEEFGKRLYGVEIVETKEDGQTTTTWRQINAAPNRAFSKKIYWIPIEIQEINRAPQLTQNPGY